MIIKCKRCGKEFDNKGHRRVYCSRNCQRNGTANREIIAQKAIAATKYKYDVGVLYDRQCAVCSWHIDTAKFPKGINGKYLHSRGCVIHHIIPVADGGKDSLDNLIMLCPNCHALAHAGVLTTEDLTAEIPADPRRVLMLKAARITADCADRIAEAIGL